MVDAEVMDLQELKTQCNWVIFVGLCKTAE